MRQQLSIMTLSNFMPSLSSSIKFLFCSPATCYSLYLRPLLCQPQSTQLLCLGSSRWLPKLLQVQEMIQVKTVLLTTISFASSHKAIGPHCWLSSEHFTLSPLPTMSLGGSFFGWVLHLNPLPSLNFDILPTVDCLTLQKRKVLKLHHCSLRWNLALPL